MRKLKTSDSAQQSYGLADVRRLLSEGRLDELPSNVTINLDKFEKSDFQALVQLLQQKDMGHEILRNKDVVLDELNKIRVQIYNGRYQEALEETETFFNTTDPEIIVQRIKIYNALGFYGLSKSMAEAALHNFPMNMVTKGVVSQLLGQACFELDDSERAHACFESALEIANVAGNPNGRLSARLFLAKFYAHTGQFRNANEELRLSEKELVDHITNFRWSLGYYRTLSQVLFLQRKPSCLQMILATMHLASAIGDKVYYIRGLIECALMIRSFGLESDLLRKAILTYKELIQSNKSDLRLWLMHFLNDRIAIEESVPKTLRAFLDLAKASDNKRDRSLLEQCEHTGLSTYDWFYDTANGFFFDLKNSQRVQISPETPMAHLIVYLSNKQMPIELSEVFESVWKIKWNSDRHVNTLNVTLIRLKKLIPGLIITRKFGCLHLESKGFIALR